MTDAPNADYVRPRCDACGSEMTEPGALAFSPPTALLSVCSKYHLCVECWAEHFVVFADSGWVVEHPFRCRLTGNLATCQVTAAMESCADDGLRGRFRIVSLDGGEHGSSPQLEPAQIDGSGAEGEHK